MNEIIKTTMNIPAHLAGRIGKASKLADTAAAGIGTGGIDYPRISIKGGRFRIVEGGAETVMDSSTIEVVVVGASRLLTKQWYAKAWTPDAEAVAPDCFSLNGLRPDPASTSPQADMCAECEHNVWGSKITPQGTKIKACPDQKRIAVVAADDPSGPVYLLTITPAALTSWAQYSKKLKMHGVSPDLLRTKVSFDTSASFPKLIFSNGDFNDAGTQATIDSVVDNDAVRHVLGDDDNGDVAEVPKPAAKPALVRAAKPAPVEEVVEEEEAAPVEEPAKPAARGFGKTKAAAEPDEEVATKPAARGFGKSAPAKAARPAAKAVQATSAKTLSADIENMIRANSTAGDTDDA
jgi:hypothetical protein